VRTLISAALVTALLATSALAGDRPPVFVESRSITGKAADAFTVNPAKAYILLRTDVATPLYLMKVPTAEDQAAYQKLRDDAFAEAREKYARKKASYERTLERIKDYPKTDPGWRQLGEKPIEPTEENFEFTAFGLMAAVGLGPMNRFAKGTGASTYLEEVTPGEYRLYGMIDPMGANGPMGNCFCMGSVKFEARAGEITDMGVILTRQAEAVKPPPGDSSMPQLVDIPNFLGSAPPGIALDPRLAGFTVRRAAYRPVGKLPNYFGVTLARVPEMPGVLRYERDRIVDLTAR
jgi:hypothetical protein